MPTSARTDRGAGRLFAQSPKDGILALIGFAHVSGLALAVVWFDALSWLARGGVVVGGALLTCTNFQCIAHNAVHLPFFRWRALNGAFAAINGIALGYPQHLYRAHHLNHHKYNNDRGDQATGATLDRSSLFRNSRRPGQPLSAPRYVAGGLARGEFGALYREASAQGARGQVWIECAVLVAFGLWAIATNWLAFLVMVVPATVVGYALALLENYAEHCGAEPGDRLTDSVSCYARWYNWIWFNNGYHQEHHFRPQTHWTAVPALREQMLPESRRRVVPGLHLAALWLGRGRARPVTTAGSPDRSGSN